MMLLRKILKCIFVFLALTGLLLILRRNGVLQSCGIGIYVLAPSVFYPEFYGNKWDYLRVTVFLLIAAIVAAGLIFISDQINHISGMEGMKMGFLKIEIFLFSTILVLTTTAFCCRMKKILKTAIPGIVFVIYAMSGFFFTSSAQANFPDFYFLLFGIVPLLLLLPLNIIMSIRILIFPEAKKPL